MSDIKRIINHGKVKQLVRELLVSIGEDPDRPGLEDTPRRVADFYRDFVEYDAGRTDTVFESVRADQMVVVSGMRVWSLCEHHLLPFWCDVTVGYITDEQRVLGLSKFARIAQRHAHKLQLQERLVNDIAIELRELLGENVAVVASGEHLCMTMRGVRTPARMISSSMNGVFRNEAQVRAEFLSFVTK